MPFLSNYFELNNILSNRPPRVTVIFHEKRIGILSKLQKVVKSRDFLIHKKVPDGGLVSKCISESHRRHEIPRSKSDSFLFENVNFLDGDEISAIKKATSSDGRVVLLYALPAAEIKLLEEGEISKPQLMMINLMLPFRSIYPSGYMDSARYNAWELAMDFHSDAGDIAIKESVRLWDSLLSYLTIGVAETENVN